jgi:hypothetical protein
VRRSGFGAFDTARAAELIAVGRAVTDQPSRDDLTIRPCHLAVAAVSRARP